jgi:glucose-1-phosphatase
MSEIDAVIFDLGNVLVKVDEAFGLKRLGARVKKPPEEVEAYFRRTPYTVELAMGKMTKRGFFHMVARDLAFDGTYDEFADIWSTIFSPIEPMIALAEGLREKLPRLLLSNTNIIHMEHIYRQFPFVSEFDQQILSYEVGLLKPDSAIYRHTLVVSGLNPARTLFIDDLRVNVDAARAMGIRGLHFEDAGQVKAELEKLGVVLT